MRLRGGGDGSAQSGKWLQTCVRNQLFFLFLLGCSHLLPSHVDAMRTSRCQRFVIAANPDATAGEVPVVEAVFQVSPPPGKNPRASDGLSRDHTSRHGLLSNQQGSGLCPKPHTWRFYMRKKSQCWEQKCQGFEYRIEFQENRVITSLSEKPTCMRSFLHAGRDSRHVCILMH